MSDLAWFALAEAAAIAGLVALYWHTRDERDDAIANRWRGPSIFVGPGRDTETIAGAFDLIDRKGAADRDAAEIARVEAANAGSPRIEKMPAADRRVLEAMAASWLCTTNATITSVSGVMRGNVSRVTRRLEARGFLRRCGLHGGSGWLITDAGREAVR